MGEIFKLFGTIGVDTKSADKALDDFENKGKSTTNKVGGFFSKLSNKVGQTLSGIGNKIDFKGMSNQFNAMGSTINNGLLKAVKVGGLALAAGGAATMAAAGATLVKSMNLAGELEQNMGGSEAVFGKYATQMQKTGSTAFEKMGLSQSDFLANANKMGSLYQGAGFSVKESMTMTSDSMQRASDVASIMGIDVGSAMEAVSGMAKGNFEMMDNLGVAMNDTTIGNYALSKGIQKSTQQMTTQEKVGLATQMFMEKTAKYAGNYAKENDTLSGSLQTAKSALSNFMSGAGNIDAVISSGMNFAKIAGKSAMELAPKLFEGLLKAVQTLIPQIPSIISGLAKGMANTLGQMFGDDVKSKFESLIGIISGAVEKLSSAFSFVAKYKDIFMPMAVGIGVAVGFLSAWNAATTVFNGLMAIRNAYALAAAVRTGALTAATAAQTAATMGASGAFGILNAVMNANPIAIIVLALIALVAGLTYFFTQTKTGQAIWQAFTSFLTNAFTIIKDKAIEVFNGIAAFLTGVWTAITTNAQLAWTLFSTIVGGVISAVVTVIKTVFDGLRTFLGALWEGIKAVAMAVWTMIGNLIVTLVTGYILMWQAMFQGFAAFLSALWNGIKLVVSTVWNTIRTIISTVVQAIVSVAVAIFNGLRNSIINIFNAIRNTASTVWNAIRNTISSVVSGISSTVSSIFNGLKGTVTGIWNGIHSAISGVVNGIRNTISGAFNGLSGIVSNAFNAVKSAMVNPINAARDALSGAINAIRGFFNNLRLDIPKPRIPHISVNGGSAPFGIGGKGSLPSFNVDWYAKGGIMTQPTFFGMNGNSLMGGGEAGKEAVLPLDKKNLAGIGAGVADAAGLNNSKTEGDIIVYQTINSPDPLTPRETARQTKLALQDLAALR
ncbi:phage tail protein [Enterococcus avium]|uniref:phage tail protein n=1 Tax=Enterococcus avium TaxID=33945 RepID=UPI003DA3BB18